MEDEVVRTRRRFQLPYRGDAHASPRGVLDCHLEVNKVGGHVIH